MNQAFRSMQLMVLSLLAIVGLWVALPSIASTVLERWLEHEGYEQVMVNVGRPDLRSLTVPQITLARRLTGEMITVSLNNAQAEYTLLGLLAGRVDRLTLHQVSIEIVTFSAVSDQEEHQPESIQDAPDSLVNALTASDVVQRLPFFPWDEVRLEEVKLFREQATGPLRTVVMSGTIKHEREALVAEMLLQGVDTIPYELRVTGQSPADMSLQMRAAQPNASPFVLWRSQAVPKESQVHIEGILEVNVRELAPFLALVVPIGSDWQRVDGNVTVHWVGTAASGVPVGSLLQDPATEVHATLQVSAVLPELKGYGKDLTVKTTGTFSGNARLVHWTLSAGASATATVTGTAVRGIGALSGLVHYGLQPMRLDNAQDSTGELYWGESPPRFTASGPMRLSYGSQHGPVYVECIITQIAGRGLALDHADAQVLIKGSLPSPWHQPIGVKQFTGQLQGAVTWTGTTLRGAVSPSSTVTFVDFNQGSLRSSGGSFVLEEPLPLEIDLSNTRWSSGPATWVWQSPRLQADGVQVVMQRASFKVKRTDGSGRAYHADVSAMLDGVLLERSGARSAPVDLSVQLTADSKLFKADIQTRDRDRPIKLAARVEHEWATGHGTAHATLDPVVFGPATFRLGQLWTPWSFPVDVTEGSVAATFDWRWTNNAQQQLHVQGGSADIAVERLAGHYHDVEFTGMNTKLKVAMEGVDRVAVSRPAEVAIVSIQTGVDVTDVTMTVEGEWDLHEKLPLIEVRNIRCRLLGGTATSQGARADLAYPPYGLTVLFRELDLHKILDLEQQKGLQGTGILDGSIPLTVTSQGLTVNEGSFEARPPGGVIRYAASPEVARAVTQANANTQFVLQALSNFQYNVLQVGARYAENGTLQLDARLEGKNPDQKKSPPIHFNLTVQENIPALLKSLRLVNDLEDSVRNRFSKPSM
ncbi:MAG TPA: YdbH domain-containing protein [Nitrospira sp.]|nr:YdbH domain-containing protein [Nitrospira sp.]